MKTFMTFLKKEFTEQVRTRRLMILGLLFIFFGILNSLTAKMTPMILEMMSETMENSGITITDIEITALDSWVQFFKNMPMLLIIFVFMQSSIFSKEYQNGTLTLVLTKGFERYKVVLSKVITLFVIWTTGYLACFAITYAYSAYYWDNSIAQNLFFTVFICWMFGVFAIALFTLLTINFENSGSALALTGGVIFVIYLISLLPKVSKFLPTALLDNNSLIYGINDIAYYIPSLIITMSLVVVLVLGAIFAFNKKKI